MREVDEKFGGKERNLIGEFSGFFSLKFSPISTQKTQTSLHVKHTY
tara:strand:- start:295 stop:432 length:138 start_codon:yes stop_codon:yes gene_type:complete